MSFQAALTPSPRGQWGRLLLDLDARPKIVLALLVGLTLWRLPGPVMVFLAAAGAAACFLLGGFSRRHGGLWQGGLAFLLVWAALKFALGILGGANTAAALADAADLGLRLSALLLLGLGLALSAPPHRLGQGLAWLVRPVLGQKSWQVALSLSLMIHFLPLAWASASGVMDNLSRRWPGCPWPERIRLVPLALFRIMSQNAWNQTLAVAARGLDQPAAWQPGRPVHPAEWLACLAPGCALLVLAVIQ